MNVAVLILRTLDSVNYFSTLTRIPRVVIPFVIRRLSEERG